MAEKPRYYITTAISYPNGPPHIGHAYEVIATDAIARFKRLDGYDVFFLTGTDEHGQKIQQTATREGIAPRELVDRNVARFRAMVERLNCSNDDFIRTTETRHRVGVQKLLQACYDNGDIELDTYRGLYCVACEAYYVEDDLDGANCPIHKKPVEHVEEEVALAGVRGVGYEQRHAEALLEGLQERRGVRRGEVLRSARGRRAAGRYRRCRDGPAPGHACARTTE